MVGPPAVGKSTWLKKNAPDSYVVSRDDIVDKIALKKGMAYDDTFETPPKDMEIGHVDDKLGAVIPKPEGYPDWMPDKLWSNVFNANKEIQLGFKNSFGKALRSGKDIAVDMTLMNKAARDSIMKEFGEDISRYDVEAVNFNFQGEQTKGALKQIASRRADEIKKRGGSKTIPESVFDRMFDSYEAPSLDEGFNSIIQVDDRRRIRSSGAHDGFVPNFADLDIGRIQNQEKSILPYVIEDFIEQKGGKFKFDGQRFSDYIYANWSKGSDGFSTGQGSFYVHGRTDAARAVAQVMGHAHSPYHEGYTELQGKDKVGKLHGVTLEEVGRSGLADVVERKISDTDVIPDKPRLDSIAKSIQKAGGASASREDVLKNIETSKIGRELFNKDLYIRGSTFQNSYGKTEALNDEVTKKVNIEYNKKYNQQHDELNKKLKTEGVTENKRITQINQLRNKLYTEALREIEKRGGDPKLPKTINSEILTIHKPTDFIKSDIEARNLLGNNREDAYDRRKHHLNVLASENSVISPKKIYGLVSERSSGK